MASRHTTNTEVVCITDEDKDIIEYIAGFVVHQLPCFCCQEFGADDVPQVALPPLQHSLEHLPGKKECDCLICTDRTRGIFTDRQVMEKHREM